MSNERKELEVTFDISTIDHLGVKLYSTIVCEADSVSATTLNLSKNVF